MLVLASFTTLNVSKQFVEGFFPLASICVFTFVYVCLNVYLLGVDIFDHNNILNLIINSLIEACITSSLTKFYRHDIQFYIQLIASVR